MSKDDDVEVKQLLLKRKEFKPVNINGVTLDDGAKVKIGQKGGSEAIVIPKQYREKYGYRRGRLCIMVPIAGKVQGLRDLLNLPLTETILIVGILPKREGGES